MTEPWWSGSNLVLPPVIIMIIAVCAVTVHDEVGGVEACLFISLNFKLKVTAGPEVFDGKLFNLLA